MDEPRASLIALSAALSSGDRRLLDAAIDRAAAAAPAEAEEVLLQSYLFLGYPAALNAMVVWRARTALEAPPPTEDPPAGWAARGASVCSRVYGGQYDRLRTNVARLHPDAERWMLQEGYGKVLGRPGLSLETRELCIAALLAGLDAEPQLHAHLRGALNVGAAVEDVEAAVTIAGTMHEPARAAAARALWAEVRQRWESRAG